MYGEINCQGLFSVFILAIWKLCMKVTSMISVDDLILFVTAVFAAGLPGMDQSALRRFFFVSIYNFFSERNNE